MICKPLAMALLLSSFFATSAQAHFFSEAYDCKAPVKPLEFITELDRQQFEQQVDQYRTCLQSFIDKQNSAMAKHQTAAQKAVDGWNRYAQSELGVAPPDSQPPQ